ncbi:DJ-1/PfpI family protein [Halobaculum sp. MBLA0147]|uniref:DJ-1/PfpI family protein n=1 Tax=Halobaculum sp. MBLA0147 TaxID=3079934 RepID=UPI003525B746
MHVAITLYEGFDELDAVGPFEVFQNAGAGGADCSARLVTLSPTDTVTASHGLRVEPDGVLSDPDAADAPDLVVVPGGGWNDRAETGCRAEYESGALPTAVHEHHAAGATVASVCTGGMLLAAAGLLDGRPAVTHASALDDLRETGAEVREERVVDDGDVVTAGGVTSGIDLAVHLVEREFGAAVAEDVTTTMEYERRD